jgi:hypothetical protein
MITAKRTRSSPHPIQWKMLMTEKQGVLKGSVTLVAAATRPGGRGIAMQ